MNDFAKCGCETKVLVGLANFGMEDTIDVQEQHRREIKGTLSRIRMQGNNGDGRFMGQDHFFIGTLTAEEIDRGLGAGMCKARVPRSDKAGRQQELAPAQDPNAPTDGHLNWSALPPAPLSKCALASHNAHSPY